MNNSDLLERLSNATAPDRFLDAAIAQRVGYTRESIGDGRSKWFDPHGKEVAKVPLYTRYIEEARRLAEVLAPNRAIAVTWDAANGSAVIDGGERQEGANAAIALCMAALRHENL